jgi:ribosomal protein S18 acetylase RimI-like enzyme
MTPQHQALQIMPCSAYTADELAEIYNLTRVDYIVPMPMNGRRMADYIRQYDLDLAYSQVALDEAGQVVGLLMLGLRPLRMWITRLGIVPQARGAGIGNYLMNHALETSAQLGIRLLQLEVINGNEPAYRLFKKFGFEDLRELTVLRRSPSTPSSQNAVLALPRALSDSEIAARLPRRDYVPAWTEETPSMLNGGEIFALRGFELTDENGEIGWLLYIWTPYQLSHLVFSPNPSPEMARGLLYYLHKLNPYHDTKTENVPRGHRSLDAFDALGYVEEFARTEMSLYLDLS